MYSFLCIYFSKRMPFHHTRYSAHEDHPPQAHRLNYYCGMHPTWTIRMRILFSLPVLTLSSNNSVFLLSFLIVCPQNPPVRDRTVEEFSGIFSALPAK